MAPAAPSPLLKLFGVDRPGPGHSLQHIRDKIYSYAWSRVRRDDYKLDFVISESGINRNVPERLISGEDLYGSVRAPRVPPPPCNLHLVNKQVSKDFVRYIYSVNNLEVDVDLKALCTKKCQAALHKIATQLRNPNFQKHTRNVRIRIHFPADYPAANLPQSNQRALDDIAFALDHFQHLGHLAIRIVPGQDAPLDYELRLAAFPFYPMRMTNWSIRILNTATFPYTWDLVDAQRIAFLNRAYAVYQQTGSLTAPIQPSLFEGQSATRNLVLNNKSLQQASSSFRQPTNGSQKRRERRKRAAEAAVAIDEASAEAAVGVPKQAVSTAAISKFKLLDSKANVTHSTKTRAEELSQQVKANDSHLIAGKTSTDEPLLDCEGALNQISGIEHSCPTSAPSPPPEKKHVSGHCLRSDPLIPSPSKSSDGRAAIDIATLDPADVKTEQSPEPSSPAPSSATLAPQNDGLMAEHVGDVIETAREADENTAQAQQARKLRRNKKGKKNTAKSKPVQCAELHHDAGSKGNTHIEIEMETTEQEHSETSSSVSNRFDLSQGIWSSLGTSYAVFTHSETGTCSLYPRNAHVERYLRQQERIFVTRAETEGRQKQVKAKQQARKARQVLLRRESIASNSPLSRAMERPRDKSEKQVKSQSRFLSPKLGEDMARAQIEHSKIQGCKRKIQEQMGKLERQHDIAKKRDFPRVVELQEEEEDEIEEQLDSRCAAQHHHLHVSIDNDDDADHSLTQEHSESTGAEDSGEELDEASLAEEFICHGFSVKVQKKDLEPYRLKYLGPRPNEEVPHLAGNDNPRPSEGSHEEGGVSQLGSPIPLVLMPQGEKDVAVHNSDAGMTHSPDQQKAAFCETESMLSGERELVDGIDFSEGNPLRDIYPESGPIRKPASQLHDNDNDFDPSAAPVPFGVPFNGLPSQRGQNEDPLEHGQRSARILESEETQCALVETVQCMPGSDQLSFEGVHYASEGGHPTPESGQYTGGGRHENRSRHGRGHSMARGNYVPARGSYRGNHRGGRTSNTKHRVEKTENPWAVAVQESDREFTAQSQKRRLALEQEMQVKGATYADYATPIEDSFVKLDEHRKPVDEKNEHISYGPR